VCVCARARVCVCVCVCVRARVSLLNSVEKQILNDVFLSDFLSDIS